MDNTIIYSALARRFVNFQNLITIPIEENNDTMEDVSKYGIRMGFAYSLLEPSTGWKMMLRKAVCEKLLAAERILRQKFPNYSLVLVYAYRSMTVQKESFERMRIEMGLIGRNDPEALEKIHHFIAVPEVAGHPTGGAVDVLIEDSDGNSLDFGTPMHALEKNSYAFCPFISDEATLNRKLLRSVMQSVGFAPYDGEWWHYSYGDREWAAYYNEPIAVYGQLEAGTFLFRNSSTKDSSSLLAS